MWIYLRLSCPNSSFASRAYHLKFELCWKPLTPRAISLRTTFTCTILTLYTRICQHKEIRTLGR
jgi:hypothetical protein